jgi:hypothetical protein
MGIKKTSPLKDLPKHPSGHPIFTNNRFLGCLVKDPLFGFEIVGMLAIFHGHTGHAIILARPGAEIDCATSFRTEGPIAI